MGCKHSKTAIETTQQSASANFRGPTERRGCTDVLCVLVIFASWTVMTWIGVFSFQNGDYRRLLSPVDYSGNMCGVNNTGGIDMTDYPYLYPVNFYLAGVCVTQCPRLRNHTVDPFTLITYNGIYHSNYTGSSSWSSNITEVASYGESGQDYKCTQDSCFASVLDSWDSEGINQGYGYAFYLVDTTTYLKHCIVSSSALNKLQSITSSSSDELEESLKGLKYSANVIQTFYADIYTARMYVFGFGFCLSVVIGLLYLYGLRMPCSLPIFIWGSILVTLVVCSGAGYCANMASRTWNTQVPKKHTDNEILALRVFGYFLWSLGGLFFLIVIGLRKRILLAIGLVKQSSKALSSMPLLTLLPVLQCAAIVVFVLIWMIYAANLASLGEFVPVTMEMNNVTVTFRSYTYDDPLQYAAWYLLFCFFWTTQFILALGEIIAAMSVAHWYFSPDRSSIGNCTVMKCFCQSLLYHAGTAALGSLIIAVVETISAFLAYLQRRIQPMVGANKVAKVILYCLQCVMCCLDNVLKYVNKNAYIQCAIFGSNFCCSAREAFFLILRNAARLGTLTIICGVVAFIGKVFIALVTGGISYVILDQYVPLELTNPAGPAILISIVAYCIGSSFMSILSMAVNTMLHCYVVDKEILGGHDSFSPKSLHKWIEENKDASITNNNETAVAVAVAEEERRKQVDEDNLAHV